MTDFHRRAAILAPAGPSFFELLGRRRDQTPDTWKQADLAVQQEALTRLKEYPRHALPCLAPKGEVLCPWNGTEGPRHSPGALPPSKQCA
jgi:hypothetical protein